MQKGRGKSLAALVGSVTADVIPETHSREAEDSVVDADLGLDQIFEILKNPRRRYVLRYLREVADEVTLGDLSEQIAAWENEKEIQQVSSSERKRVYVGLYQVHLPKMDGMDIVSFDKSRAIIEPGPTIDLLYGYLNQHSHNKGHDWSKYYVGVTGATVVALLVAMLVEAIAGVPAVSVAAGGALVAFATLALIHYRTKRADGIVRTGQFQLPTSRTQP